MIFLGVVIVMLFTITAFARFEYGLLFALFVFILVPRYVGVDPGYGLPIINAQRIFLGILLIIWLMKKVVLKRKILPKTILDRQIIALLLIQLVSVFSATTYFNASLLKLFQIVFEQYLIYYLIIYTIKSKPQIERLVRTIVLALMVVSIFGIIEYYLGYYIFSFLKPVRSELQSSYGNQFLRFGTLRIMSTMGSGRILGMCLILLIPLSLLFSVKKQNTSHKYFWGVVSIVFIVALYFTKSRASLLGFLVSLVVIYPIYKKYFISGIKVILPIILMFYILNPATLSRETYKLKIMLSSIMNPSQFIFSETETQELGTAAYSRIRTQMEVFNLVKKRPLRGYGLKWPPEIITTGSDVNWFSGIVLGSGIFTLPAYLWIIIRLIRKLQLHLKRKNDNSTTLIFGLMGGVIAFQIPLAIGLSSDAFYLLWVIIALSVISLKMDEDSDISEEMIE
jgi:O-antigen ligase